jgi:hypothetical protein
MPYQFIFFSVGHIKEPGEENKLCRISLLGSVPLVKISTQNFVLKLALWFILKMQMVCHGQHFHYLMNSTDQGFCNAIVALITVT